MTVEELVLKVRSKAKASRPAIAIQLKLAGYISDQQLRDYLKQLEQIRIAKNQSGEAKILLQLELLAILVDILCKL